MSVNTIKIKNNILEMIDKVVKTGRSVTFTHKGAKVEIRSQKMSKTDKLIKHDCISGDPQGLVHIDWSDNWNTKEL